jgi:hypothetical protein
MSGARLRRLSRPTVMKAAVAVMNTGWKRQTHSPARLLLWFNIVAAIHKHGALGIQLRIDSESVGWGEIARTADANGCSDEDLIALFASGWLINIDDKAIEMPRGCGLRPVATPESVRWPKPRLRLVDGGRS